MKNKNIFATIYKNIEYTFLDYPDNKSWALLIYFIGCEHNCKGCYNQIFKRENRDTIKLSIDEFIEYINKYRLLYGRTNKIVFSGGDPLYINNRRFVKKILPILFIQYNYKVCVYTGYTIEEVKKWNITGFEYIKCGKYDINCQQKSYKNDDIFVLASTNQNFYNYKYEKISNNGILNF